jgi:hypothetical protein
LPRDKSWSFAAQLRASVGTCALTGQTATHHPRKTNLGLDGIQAYLKTHKCNHICRSLGLPEIASTRMSGEHDTIPDALGVRRTGSADSQGSSEGEWAPPGKGGVKSSPCRSCAISILELMPNHLCVTVHACARFCARCWRLANGRLCHTCRHLFGRTASVSPLRLPAATIPEGRAKSPLRW